MGVLENVSPQVAAPPTAEELVQQLLRGESYPDHPARVELLETHISWLFLTDRHVYKLKKPVRFEFLDFSSLPRREAACRQELHLNRRWSGNTYQDVLPVTLDRRGQVHVGGSGRVLDWVVKMRRLAADRSLDQLIRTGRLSDRELDQLAQRLAEFYQRLPPYSIGTEEYRRTLESHVRANWETLAASPSQGAVIDRIHGRQLRWMRVAPDLLDHRVLDGRIVEGHGDLRPEHIYLDPQPLVIDCVEFNAEFRRLDVLDELGFLAMECDLLDAGGVGQKIIHAYLQHSNDRPPRQLLAFYKSYRACVRAKVAQLRAQQTEDSSDPGSSAPPSVAACLARAEIEAHSLGQNVLLVVRGLPGTGKSTLAEQLAEHLHMPLLQTDAIRRELLGLSAGAQAYNQGPYRPEQRLAVYDEMLRRADRWLASGQAVILDGTFLQAGLRRAAVDLAERHQAASLLVRCHCSDELARERIQARQDQGGSLSETRPEFFGRQQAAEEPDASGGPSLTVDTSVDPLVAVEQVVHELRPLLIDGLRLPCS